MEPEWYVKNTCFRGRGEVIGAMGVKRCGVGYAVCVYVCGGEGEGLTRIMLSKWWYMWYY